MLFKVLVHGYPSGIYSSWKLEEAYRYRIDFMWLLEDQKVPDYSTLARFRTGRCRAKDAERPKEIVLQKTFRWFLTAGKVNVRIELFLLALAFNLKKLWMKRKHGRLQTHVSEK